MKIIPIISLLFVLASTADAQEIVKAKIPDIERLMASKDSSVLVLNFWATFCKPCVAEIPSFIEITNKYKADKVKLVLVSLDLPSYYPGKIAAFSKKHKFNTNIMWLAETNADYFCPRIDSSWSGSIPATLIINSKNNYRFFIEGEISADAFESEVKKAIGKG